MKFNPRTAVLWLIVLTMVGRLWGAAVIGWGTGESYYLSSARVLHLSYYDQPPLSLWLIWATKTLFQSENELILRLPFVVMFGWTTWLVYRLGERLRSARAGFFAALILNSSLLFVISIGSWIQPDAPMLALWLLCVHALIDVFFGDGEKPWFGLWAKVGLVLGLTFLAKYHAVFLLVGAGLFVLAHAPSRRWILHPGPYVAMGIAALISAPVWIWNAQNQWVSFAFQGGRALGESGLHWDWLIRMALGQLLYNSPWIAVPALVAGGMALVKGPKRAFPPDSRAGMSWFLAIIAAPPILLFTLVALWSDTQFHFHWQAPGYILLFPILGAWADAGFAKRKTATMVWLVLSFVLTNLVIASVVSHTANGWMRTVFPQMGDDPTADALNWSELGEYLRDEGTLADPDNFVAGLGWIACGKIDPQVRGKLPLACFSADPRNIAFNVDLSALGGKTAYFVLQSSEPLVALAGVAGFFDTLTPIAQIDISRAGRVEIRDIRVVKAENFSPDRTYAGNGDNILSVTGLPRLAISRLQGRVENVGVAQDLVLTLDGVAVHEFSVGADASAIFAADIALPKWSPGLRQAEIGVRGAGSGADVQIMDLTIIQR